MVAATVYSCIDLTTKHTTAPCRYELALCTRCGSMAFVPDVRLPSQAMMGTERRTGSELEWGAA